MDTNRNHLVDNLINIRHCRFSRVLVCFVCVLVCCPVHQQNPLFLTDIGMRLEVCDWKAKPRVCNKLKVAPAFLAQAYELRSFGNEVNCFLLARTNNCIVNQTRVCCTLCTQHDNIWLLEDCLLFMCSEANIKQQQKINFNYR